VDGLEIVYIADLPAKMGLATSSSLTVALLKGLYYYKQIGVSPAGISVRDFKARWGSCHKNGSVVFNWNIIKAPHSIVDYVVIHELCHLLYPNHSKDFWQLVSRHDELYSGHREWLKLRGKALL
jgi:predicted metal-dependent hydrolase